MIGVGLAKRRSLVAAAPLALSVAACGAPAATPAGVGARDSAGVRIVSSDVSAALPQWTIAAGPTTSIGVEQGDEPFELSGVTDAVRLDDGTLAVANAGTSEIRFFGADGRFLRRLGRNGEGPGEFRVLWRLFPLPDGGIAAWDVALRRITIFAANDSVAGTWTPEPVAGQAPDVVAALRDRSFLVAPEDRYQGRNLEQPRRDTLPFVRWSADADRPDTIGLFPGRQQFEMYVAPVQLLEDTPFGPSTGVAIDADALYVGDNDRPEVRVFAMDGRLVRVVRLIEPERPVTPDDVARFREANIDPGWRATYQAAKRRFLEIVPFPDRMPWFGPLLVDQTGDLWIAGYRTASEEKERPATWWIFDANGTLQASVATPAGLRVVQVGRDWLLGIRADDTGVERVELLSLERAGPDRARQ